MNAGLHELPLVIFTVFAQSAVGAWLIFTVVLCRHTNQQSRSYIHKVMLIPLALLAVGFLASVMHLGSPWRAFNSLNRIGASMLSNEIAGGALFFALAGLYWLLAVSGKLPEQLAKAWLIVSALVGLIFMYMMNNVYHISTVPTWNNGFTTASFYLTVLLGGSALAFVLLSLNPHKDYCLAWTPWLFGCGILLAALVILQQGFDLPQIHSSVKQAAALVPDYAAMSAVRLCALAVAAVIFVKLKTLPAFSLAVILVMVAEMIGRTLFYGAHMIVGMA